MEINFDMDQFEESLKQQADQFSMIPSERVWSGIYNSLHPGSRWPSLTMIVIFLLTIVGIGPLNHFTKDRLFKDVPDNTAKASAEEIETDLFAVLNSSGSNESGSVTSGTPARIIPIESNSKFTHPVLPQPETSAATSAETLVEEENAPEIIADDSIENIETEAIIIPLTDVKPEELTLIIEQLKDVSLFPGSSEMDLNGKIRSKSTVLALPEMPVINGNLSNSILKYEILSDSSSIDEEGGAEAGNKTLAVRKSKTTWIFFATPAISNTYFIGDNTENQPLINPSPLMINPNQIRPSMRFNARLGLSVGGEMNHEIAENWEIVSGAQITYSGYNILAHKVHPTFSYLYIKDGEGEMVPKKYITYYGSGEGQDETVLHNNSIQLSLPVGLKYTVWKNNQIEVKVGTSVLPSAIVKGQAYILSADGKNYVMDPDLMKDINLSGELNSSISFQGEKMKWHIGPTIRFQALSSYKKIYPVNEHLVDYGIKIGISK